MITSQIGFAKLEYGADTREGSTGWRSPSNIALVKYWGKRHEQIPQNPSVSFTLSNAFTESVIHYSSSENDQPEIQFFLDGSRNETFEDRVRSFVKRISKDLTFLKTMDLRIESSNSFPHSTGIASSASGMSALALCLCQIEQQLCTRAIPDDEFLLRSSYVARIGSGSACRSIYSPIAVWGKTESFPGSSDFWAVPAEDIHDVFSSFHDDIVIVSSKKKSVSSSAGHDLMKNHMFAHQRFEQARKNMALMACFLKEGEVFELGNKVEEEALTLHAMMMCSDPSYILMKAGTLEILDSIRSFRRDTGIPIFFTLDAGPNVHILYPDENRQEVKDFLAQEIVPHAENGRIIEDHVGSGPKQIL